MKGYCATNINSIVYSDFTVQEYIAVYRLMYDVETEACLHREAGTEQSEYVSPSNLIFTSYSNRFYFILFLDVYHFMRIFGRDA